MKDKLQRWTNETKELGDFFVTHYFGRDADSHWIADEIGGVLYVNDYFFNLRDIVEFMRYRYSKNKMFEYYEYQLKCIDDKTFPVNIKSYRHVL